MRNSYLALILVSLAGNAQLVGIPDPAFKNALVNTLCIDTNEPPDGTGDVDVDTNNDGEIQVSEAQAVTTAMLVGNKSIASLEGIKAFTNLKRLHCGQNQLTTFDVSDMSNLVSINCFANQITTINIDGLVNLAGFEGSSNLFTALDFSHTKVSYLWLGGCPQLTYLNIRNGYTSPCTIGIATGSCMQYLGTEAIQVFCVDDNEMGIFQDWVDMDPAIFTTDCSLGLPKAAESSFAFYPNPATQTIHVALDESQALKSVTIYNSLGQPVKKSTGNAIENIDISDLENGVYLVEIATDKGKATKKMIKV
jgi:type IX secretion system substrate protein